MNSINKTVRPGAEVQALHEFVRDACDSDSNTLYELASIVKLAAFATEARRTLEGINDALEYREDTKDAIEKSVECVNNWREMPDIAGDVLQTVARRIESLSDAISERAFNLDRHPGGAAHE